MDKIKFIALSGTTSVTQNMYVYEHVIEGKPDTGDIIVVDCGVGFPPDPHFGVDLVIPDFTYVLQRKDRVKAIFVSHAHEDHFGALPFLLKDMDAPVYAAKLVVGFIEEKLVDYGLKNFDLRVIDLEKGSIDVGVFKIEPFRVTHSVPDSAGFCITTPVGKLFHVSDHKFDWTPVDQKPFDVLRAANLAKDGVLTMASDALGSTSSEYTMSEYDLEKTIAAIIQNAPGRVFLTTISSNISRMQQAINASIANGRKVVLVGRSIEKKVEIANKLGYMNIEASALVAGKQASNMDDNKLTYIISGCYGQVGSALYRAALDEHQYLKIGKGDTVIFSADPAPPGTETSVNYVVDNLIENGAEVHYYDTQEDLHVSGHGSQKEIEMLLALIRPKHLVPIGGTIRHMKAYTTLAEKMGWKREAVFELRDGESIDYQEGKAVRGAKIPVREVLVDGLGIGDVGNVVLRDRKTLAKEGIVIAVLQFDHNEGTLIADPEVISKGFVFANKQQELLDRASKNLAHEIRQRAKKVTGKQVQDKTIDYLERFFFEETGRRPMILPVVVEV